MRRLFDHTLPAGISLPDAIPAFTHEQSIYCQKSGQQEFWLTLQKPELYAISGTL
jgi:hypothetical protein